MGYGLLRWELGAQNRAMLRTREGRKVKATDMFQHSQYQTDLKQILLSLILTSSKKKTRKGGKENNTFLGEKVSSPIKPPSAKARGSSPRAMAQGTC